MCHVVSLPCIDQQVFAISAPIYAQNKDTRLRLVINFTIISPARRESNERIVIQFIFLSPPTVQTVQ